LLLKLTQNSRCAFRHALDLELWDARDEVPLGKRQNTSQTENARVGEEWVPIAEALLYGIVWMLSPHAKAARGVGDFQLGAPLPIKLTNSRTAARPRFPRVQGAVVQLGVLEEDLDERQPGVDRALDQHLRHRIFNALLQGPAAADAP
jgi:hypothetical protein